MKKKVLEILKRRQILASDLEIAYTKMVNKDHRNISANVLKKKFRAVSEQLVEIIGEIENL